MEYADTVVRVVRLTVRNPFAVVLVSVAATVSTLPLLTGVLVAGPVGAIVGLWTTSIMLGFVAVGGARMVTVVYEREVSLGTTYFWEGLRSGTTMAPVVGVGTFLIAVVTLAFVLNPLEGIPGMSVALLGVYIFLAWYILAMFALTVWAAPDGPSDVRSCFGNGGALLLKHPVAAGWVLVQSIGWTLVSIPLIIAPALILPGFVQLVSTAIIRQVAEET